MTTLDQHFKGRINKENPTIEKLGNNIDMNKTKILCLIGFAS